jgi:hypothetical protein
MKFIATALICLAALAGRAQETITPTERIDLFNGKDFSGFTFFMRSNSPPEKTWCVTNGVIHCGGRPPGFLRTEKSYANYKLTVEWRFVKVAPHADNTGVLIHMQLPDKVWSKCIECQGQNQKQGDYWLHGGAGADGFPGDAKKSVHAPMTAPPNENPIADWDTYEIIARGNAVQSIVNGKVMNQLTGCNLSSGFIGIQSEGANIEVRKIFIEPLPRQ